MQPDMNCLENNLIYKEALQNALIAPPQFSDEALKAASFGVLFLRKSSTNDGITLVASTGKKQSEMSEWSFYSIKLKTDIVPNDPTLLNCRFLNWEPFKVNSLAMLLLYAKKYIDCGLKFPVAPSDWKILKFACGAASSMEPLRTYTIMAD